MAQNCRSILEIDLAGCHSISSASVTALLENLPHLRELRLAHCIGIDNHAFTDLKPGLKFDALRILDLTACDGVGDDAISRIIPAAPRLRNLVLAKCRHITDQAVRAICTLTKNLHYIHLGHCHMLTDNAVIDLVTQCNRIRYIDLACCSRLTDASVRHLAKLPKLRRVGLVKCQNLTDASIIALARRPYGSGSSKPGMPPQFVSLERVHLSYCTSLTLKGITQLLLNCPRLTHLSLTGVQAFLRDDLTRFCREAPTEFTHVQRDVFCVFSGDGVMKLRDYLLRLVIEQERDQQQQSAMDEPVLGPDSPDADSMSDGTVDGNDQPMDFSYDPGRHGMSRTTTSRARPRPRSLHDLPHPNFHIDMPLLPSDMMQRIGPWTPGAPLTPEMRAQLAPPHLDLMNTTPLPPYHGQPATNRGSSPLHTPGLTLPTSDNNPRSRSQSRRHTMEDGFFGSQSRAYLHEGPSSRDEIFSSDHMALPIFQTSMHGPSDPGPALPTRPETRRGNSALRPDPTVSSFEVNHDAILSTVPTSRGPSRGQSRSNSPSMFRVQSRSRFGDFFSNLRAVSSSPLHGESSGSRQSRGSREREGVCQRQRSELRSRQEQPPRDLEERRSRYEEEAGPSSLQLPRFEFPNLPRDLMEQMGIPSPNTPMDSPGELQRLMHTHTTRRQDQNNGNDRLDDVNMTH